MNDDPSQNGEQRFAAPALRQFTISRRVRGSDNRLLETETLIVNAHVVQHAGANADVLMFFDYVVDPIVGPSTRMHRIVRGDTDLMETTPTASQIIQ